MQSRRILLAFSLAASTASVAFADMVDLSPAAAQDSLGQLTKTLSSGSYAHPDDMDIPATSEIKVSVGEKSNESVTLLNNASIEAKYGRNYSSNYSSNPNSYTSNANNYTASANNPYSSWLIAHPLPNSRVSSNYGGRTMNGRAERHSGLDLAAPSGTPIYATGPGVVTKSGWGTGYGQYVEVNHGNGYLTRYAHASSLIARVGDRVAAGDHIANVGCTGRCTGPHLHYEVVKDGQRKNPSSYLAMLP